ncbi:MAG: LamG-like jellyroll fold domain-containing protein [Verrucomicrobiota bacterium]
MKTAHLLASIVSWIVLHTAAFAIPEPLIYSTFDGGSGSPGEITGALDSVSGQIGDALIFARDDANFVDYGDVGNPATGSLTVSAWINPNITSGGAFFPLGKGNRSSGTVGWSFFIENDVIIPRASYEGGGGDLRLGLNHPITVDEGWVHLVMVIDNEKGTFTAYYNGEPSGADGTENGWSLGGGGGQTNTFEAGQNFNPGESLLVGRRSSEGAAFDGAVDDVSIWEEALSPSDITQIYERGLAGQGIPSPDRVLAQSIPSMSVGNVATGNSFGMDFEVRAPVLLTDLGAFDSISDGFFQSPTVELWSRDDSGTPDNLADDTGNEILATASFSNEEPGTLEGGVRFKPLEEPVLLPVGDYTIVAYGWGAGEDMSDGRQRGNTGVGELADVFQVAFLGARTGGGGAFPDTAEEAGPPNLFGAGNFIVRLLTEDSDGDGLDDGWENFNFGDLTQVGDGDFDDDGATNASEFASDTNPNKADTDEDGLNDGAENAAGSNPLLADSDSDGLTDGAEVNDHGTNPTSADTDEDGFIDGVEIALETSPTDPASSPEETSVFLAVSGKSWDDPAAWSDGQAPRAGRNYFVLPELATTLLTPAGNPTFAGDSLTLAGEGTELILQPDPTGTVTIADLTMNQGTLTHGAVGEVKLAGNLEIVDRLTVGFANANSTLDLASTLTGGALSVVNDSDFAEESTRVLRLTGAGNSLTGDVTLKQVRVLAESAGSLGGGNLFLDNATLEPAYNINNPSKSLDLSGEGTRFLLNGQHVLRQISITGTPFITEAGIFTRNDFVGIDAVFETIFDEESTGNFTIVGNSGDSDEDGLLDSWEIDNFGDLATADGAGDPDADGLTNAEEFTASADPNQKDTDDDGLGDGAEVNTHGTSPALVDTDGDGLGDGDEIAAGTNPQEVDTDGDGLNDGDEVAEQTDPVNPDTDGDGVNDGAELALGGDPLDPNNVPNAFLADLLFYAPLDADDLNIEAGTASEKGPNAFEGTIEGENVAVEAGQIAQGAVFPGVDTDFISFTDEAINAGTEPFSVSFWFNVNVMQNAFMVSRGNRGSSDAGWSAWFENGNLHTRAHGVGLERSDRVGKNLPGIEEGQWYHLAIVFDREQNKMISYINATTDGWIVGGGGGQTDNLVPGADFTAGEDLMMSVPGPEEPEVIAEQLALPDLEPTPRRGASGSQPCRSSQSARPAIHSRASTSSTSFPLRGSPRRALAPRLPRGPALPGLRPRSA